MQYVIPCIVLVAAAFAAPAMAESYKCVCYGPTADALEQNGKVKADCADTFTIIDGGVSVKKSDLKVKISESNITQGVKNTEIQFHPRNSRCFTKITDTVSGKDFYPSGDYYCDTSAYMKLSPFKFTEDSDTTLHAQYLVHLDNNTARKGFAAYFRASQAETTTYLGALCVQN